MNHISPFPVHEYIKEALAGNGRIGRFPDGVPPVVINLFGPPNSGKTTLGLDLTGSLNRSGAYVELAAEFARDMVLEDNRRALACQPYILGHQIMRIERAIAAGADIVVTDSPPLLSCAYHNSPGVELLAMEAHNSHVTINLLLKTRHDHVMFGRIHDRQQADIINQKIHGILAKYNVDFIVTDSGVDGQKMAFNQIIKHINNFTEDMSPPA